MFVVCVHVQVKPEHIEEFIAASRENAANTILEPGNLRFDVLQQADDPQRFILYEVYRDEEASKAHKQTAHYARWRETVETWMAQPRKGVQYKSLLSASARAVEDAAGLSYRSSATIVTSKTEATARPAVKEEDAEEIPLAVEVAMKAKSLSQWRKRKASRVA